MCKTARATGLSVLQKLKDAFRAHISGTSGLTEFGVEQKVGRKESGVV